MMSLGLMEFMIIGLILIGPILGMLVLVKVVRGQIWSQGGGQPVKRKWQEEVPPDDPSLDRMADQGAVWLEDDGELLDLDEQGPFLEEKPKRSASGE